MRLSRSGAAAIAVLFSTTSAGIAAEMAVYSAGHADLRAAYDAEADVLQMFYHFSGDVVSEDGAVLKNTDTPPTEVGVRVSNPAAIRPDGAQWDFLGVDAGEPVWRLPQSQESGKPFLGFSTETLSQGQWGVVSWSLRSIVDAPDNGQFSLWQTNFFGEPSVLLDTSDGIDLDDVFSQGSGGHDHYNWGFSQSGIYEVEIAAKSTHVTHGERIASGIFTFFVGDAGPGFDPEGDANHDGVVDIFDVAVVSNYWGSEGPPGDVNCDGAVDIFDVATISNNWGATQPPAVVPELSANALALCGFASLALFRRIRPPRRPGTTTSWRLRQSS